MSRYQVQEIGARSSLRSEGDGGTAPSLDKLTHDTAGSGKTRCAKGLKSDVAPAIGHQAKV